MEVIGIKEYFSKFFEDKKVLVTGHTGFIGSWLAIALNELDAKVIGYALPPYTEKDNFVIANLEKKITHIIGDVRDYKRMLDVFKKYKPQIIFHLAAQPIVSESYSLPKDTYDINVGGTVNVFEAFRKLDSSKLLINFTTDKVYENYELERGYTEEDRLGGYDPYSSSKACSELVSNAYRNSFFDPTNPNNLKSISTVRCGNIIGGGDWQKDRLIPDCMNAILSNEKVLIRNPESVRPWQHVLEPIRGLLMLASKMWDGDPKFSSSWNFGPNKEFVFNVKHIVEKIIKYLGKGSYNVPPKKELEEFHETKLLLLDINKAEKFLGWKPEITINETIKFLCEWYIEENVNYDFDVKQINDYFQKIKKK